MILKTFDNWYVSNSGVLASSWSQVNDGVNENLPPALAVANELEFTNVNIVRVFLQEVGLIPDTANQESLAELRSSCCGSLKLVILHFRFLGLVVRLFTSVMRTAFFLRICLVYVLLFHIIFIVLLLLRRRYNVIDISV